MDVIATKKGYYNGIREVGSEFKLTSKLSKGSKQDHAANVEEQFSSNWMKKAIKQQAKKSDKIVIKK